MQYVTIKDVYMRLQKLFTLISFFTITPLFIVFSIVFLSYINYKNDPSNRSLFSDKPYHVSFAALPSTYNTIQVYAQEADGRVAKLQQFFNRYGSPLEPYAQDIVDAADKYGLDYEILPAIAGQESGWCKHVIENSHNCWGWGIYGSKVTSFPDYPTAIDTVSKGLEQHYVKQGLTTPQEIMQRYNPTSNANGGSWANGVNYFLNELQ